MTVPLLRHAAVFLVVGLTALLAWADAAQAQTAGAFAGTTISLGETFR